MGDEFYSVIKLITGEEIFSVVSIDENDGDPIIMLQNPVIMQIKSNHIGHYVKIKPWLNIPTDDLYLLRYDKIITMSEIKDEQMIEFYTRFQEKDDIDLIIEGKVKPNEKRGYISTVDDARKFLESLYNKPIPDKEN